ncbi:MAG: class I SAM-dependent methyltransferase [Flavobacteriaceae bacterium]
MKKESCNITNKGCKTTSETENLGEYWCAMYTDTDITKSGWYETESKPSLELIEQCNLKKDATILNVGVGASTLIDSLLDKNFSNLIANDISSCALNKIKNRIGREKNKVQWLVDDLTKPTILNDLPQLDLWNDRAVLHFFLDEKDQETYFNLLLKKVKKGGFAIIAAFNLDGATSCSGLPVLRYNASLLEVKIGSDFKLLKAFDYAYKMPNGEIRNYVYTLFQRNKK